MFNKTKSIDRKIIDYLPTEEVIITIRTQYRKEYSMGNIMRQRGENLHKIFLKFFAEKNSKALFQLKELLEETKDPDFVVDYLVKTSPIFTSEAVISDKTATCVRYFKYAYQLISIILPYLNIEQREILMRIPYLPIQIKLVHAGVSVETMEFFLASLYKNINYMAYIYKQGSLSRKEFEYPEYLLATKEEKNKYLFDV
jgi:hypothetical protein